MAEASLVVAVLSKSVKRSSLHDEHWLLIQVRVLVELYDEENEGVKRGE